MLLLTLVFAAQAAAPSATPARPAEDDKEVVCRRVEVTGTLAGFQRICRTRKQWRQKEDQGQDEARMMQDRGLITSCTVPPCG